MEGDSLNQSNLVSSADPTAKGKPCPDAAEGDVNSGSLTSNEGIMALILPL
jgi:hypothetical protein